MKYSDDLLARVRDAWGGYDRWRGDRPKLERLTRKNTFRVYCGEGRFDPAKMNASQHLETGIALNFQITGTDGAIQAFEICVAWLDASWSLMFHLDPKHERWPSHPLTHIQFQPPRLCMGNPPFSIWRIPFGETDPVRLLEYIVARLEANEPAS